MPPSSSSGHQLRVDWSLQEATLENSYLSALSSHTSYFYNIDVAFFVVEHILLPGYFFLILGEFHVIFLFWLVGLGLEEHLTTISKNEN